LEFLEAFLAYCRDHKVPLDFVSWHMYTSQPSALYWKANKVGELLKEYGFANVENIMDEWCYWPSSGDWNKMPPHGGTDPWAIEGVAKEIQSEKGAAFDASVLTLLQDTPVNIANRYAGTTLVTWGIFDVHGVPYKNYYSFKAFHDVLETPNRVVSSARDINGITALAGLSDDKSRANVLISNFEASCNEYNLDLKHLPWGREITYEKRVIDKTHDLDLVKTDTLVGTSAKIVEKVEIPSVCLLSLKAGNAK
jgi:xylan 1,4-beta-xylosidase